MQIAHFMTKPREDKSEGVTQIRLYVDRDNQKAQSVYLKLGMSECHYLMYEVEL